MLLSLHSRNPNYPAVAMQLASIIICPVDLSLLMKSMSLRVFFPIDNLLRKKRAKYQCRPWWRRIKLIKSLRSSLWQKMTKSNLIYQSCSIFPKVGSWAKSKKSTVRSFVTSSKRKKINIFGKRHLGTGKNEPQQYLNWN